MKLFRNRSNDVFDVHLSVSGMPERIESLAAKLRLKYVRIELLRGVKPDQPMLTGRVTGDLRDAMAAAEKWTTRIRAEHVWVMRRKIEAAHGTPVSRPTTTLSTSPDATSSATSKCWLLARIWSD